MNALSIHKKTVEIMQVLPQFILATYINFYFFISTEEYARIYEYLPLADNILVTISVLLFSTGGYKIWNDISQRSFVTVIALNILTEISKYIYVEIYYELYLTLLNFFFITLLIFYYPKNTTKDVR